MNKEGTTGTTAPNKTEKLISETKSVSKKKNGGKRRGAGRKPNIEKQEIKYAMGLIQDHMAGVVEESYLDKSTGKVIKRKLPRIVVMIEKLYELGKKGNVTAIDKWFDRGLGKPLQGIDLGGGIKIEDQRQPTEAEMAAANAYEKVIKSLKKK